MNDPERAALSRAWIARAGHFLRDLGAYLASPEDAAFPEDPRAPLAQAVLAEVERANVEGRWSHLRALFPPGVHDVFEALLEPRVRELGAARWVDDVRAAVRLGPTYRPAPVALFGIDGSVEELPGVFAVARSPDRKLLAAVTREAIEVRRGWDGPVVATLPMPESVAPEGAHRPQLIDVVLYPRGDAAMVIRSDGAHIARPDGVTRIFPSAAELEECEDPTNLRFDMMHGAISPDGALLAWGCQMSQFTVADARDGETVSQFGPVGSEYPHHAAFSPDGRYALFNACHFYQGKTSMVRRDQLVGLETELYGTDSRVTIVESRSRVYASAFVGEEVLLADANGWLRGVRLGSTPSLSSTHYCGGGTTAGLDVSGDEKRAVVSTYSGVVQFIDLAAGEREPFQLGTAHYRERLRIVCLADGGFWRW